MNFACWICGAAANSREHRIKKSDLKLLFPNTSQQTPLCTREMNSEKIVSIGSLKSDKLKWKSRLCHDCNTNRTQNYDMAWMHLSTYLQTHTNLAITRIKLKNVFPGSINESMLNVHLFFNKVVGCLIADHPAPIPLQPFRTAILESLPNPYLYLGFGVLRKKAPNQAFITPMQALNAGGIIEFANCHYTVKQVFVDIVYTRRTEFLRVANDTWHPNTHAKILRLNTLRVNHQIFPRMRISYP